MPSNFSRRVPEAGIVWLNGRYVKSVNLLPALMAIVGNIKRCAFQDQNTFIDEAAEREGVTIKKEKAFIDEDNPGYYFAEPAIYAGLAVKEKVGRGIWIEIEEQLVGRTGGGGVSTEQIFIYASLGSMGTDRQENYNLSTVILRGLSNFLFAMPGDELTYDWPKNAPESVRQAQGRNMVTINNITSKPDAAPPELKLDSSIPSMTVELLLSPKINK